jgi:cytochrome P450
MNSKLPPHECSIARLSDDAQVLMMAGTLTTAFTLEVCTFHLLRPENSHILRKLKTELYKGIPDPDKMHEISLPVFEQLPYLNAVIKESLRLTYGVSGRLQRISPDEALRFQDGKREWIIPAGTPVGMTSVQIHHDERLFPDSKAFSPERWLGSKDNERLEIEKYLVSFAKGSRQCLGIYLAYAEMYLCLSAMWRIWGSESVRMEGDKGILKLFETGLRDVEIEGDNFLPLVQKGSKGIRLKILS